MTIAQIKQEESHLTKSPLFCVHCCRGCHFAMICCVNKVYEEKACSEAATLMSRNVSSEVFDTSETSVLEYFKGRFKMLTLAGTHVKFETNAEGLALPECVKMGTYKQLTEMYNDYHSFKEKQSNVAFSNERGSGLPGRYWPWHLDHPEWHIKRNNQLNSVHAVKIKNENNEEDPWDSARKYDM